MKASLFITCLGDQFFPEVGRSVVSVLNRLNVEVDFPMGQTCCGQPAFNLGYWDQARAVAKRCLELFGHSEYVVAPSGSCTTMLRHYFLQLFAEDPKLKAEAESLARRSFEFSEFLVHVLHAEDVGAYFPHKVTYHDSCHLLRGLGVQKEPRRLIRAVRGIEFEELQGSDICCGFGGTFSVKFPQISVAILEDKLKQVAASEAKYLVANDSGCLMHIGGAATRREMPFHTMHLAQLLAKQE